MTGPPIREPHLDADDLQNFRRGIAEFNSGLYFECHDTLEDVWNGVRGPARDFFQGLIQISVGFYHVTNGNCAGALSLFTRALKRLQAYPDRYFGFDLDVVRSDVQRWRDEVRAPGTRPLELHDLPQWPFHREP